MLKLIVGLLLITSTVLCELKLVCYWNHNNGPVSVVDAQTCTHLHYSFLTLDSNSLQMRFQSSDEPNGLKQVLALKSQNSNLKIVAALGGGSDGGDGKYGRLVVNPQSRANFVRHAVEFLNQHNFDGLDFDWEYPACPHTDCEAVGHRPEKPGFAAILRVFFKK